MSFEIKSEVSKQYLLEENAVTGFEMAVKNGQSRLALEILVDVVHGMMEVFNLIMDDETEEETTKEVEVQETELTKKDKKPAEKKAEPKVEEKPVALKESKNVTQ